MLQVFNGEPLPDHLGSRDGKCSEWHSQP
jgi:hypothetical protein